MVSQPSRYNYFISPPPFTHVQYTGYNNNDDSRINHQPRCYGEQTEYNKHSYASIMKSPDFQTLNISNDRLNERLVIYDVYLLISISIYV